MALENLIIGIIQLVVAVVLAVVALYIGFSVLGKITKGMDEQKEIAKGNMAIGILVASVFIAIAIVVQSGVSGVSAGISKALTGDLIPLVGSIIQLILGIILAVGSIYLALSVMDKLTKGIDEFEELKKGNVAVGLEMAGVIITVAIIIQSGVLGITAGI